MKYDDVILPDMKLQELRGKIGDLSQKGIQIMVDYLNRDKYLLVQGVMKTLNKNNAADVIPYLDGALSRIDGLLTTLGEHIKQKNKSEVTE